MNTAFGVHNKSLATIDSLCVRLSNSNQAAFFGLHKWRVFLKQKLILSQSSLYSYGSRFKIEFLETGLIIRRQMTERKFNLLQL